MIKEGPNHPSKSTSDRKTSKMIKADPTLLIRLHLPTERHVHTKVIKTGPNLPQEDTPK